MKVCEVCGGLGYFTIAGAPPRGLGTRRLLCASCHGTGAILLGPESQERYSEKLIAARLRAVQEGWLEDIWDGGRLVRRVICDDVEAGVWR